MNHAILHIPTGEFVYISEEIESKYRNLILRYIIIPSYKQEIIEYADTNATACSTIQEVASVLKIDESEFELLEIDDSKLELYTLTKQFEV